MVKRISEKPTLTTKKVLIQLNAKFGKSEFGFNLHFEWNANTMYKLIKIQCIWKKDIKRWISNSKIPIGISYM